MTITTIDVLVVCTVGSYGLRALSARFKLLARGKSWQNRPYDLEHGHCPECRAIHPECTKRSDDAFWSRFRCCECGFQGTVHFNGDKQAA